MDARPDAHGTRPRGLWIRGTDVDCRAPRVRTAISSVLDGTAIERAVTRKRIFVDLWREPIELLGYCAKFVRNAVHRRDLDKTATRFE